MEKIKIVVPVSGGKDSQACLKLAAENYPKESILGLYNNTQFDHPLIAAHLKKMANLYGVEIVETVSGSVDDQCIKHKRFPSGAARFCTEELKIWPSKKFYKELAIKQGCGFEVWIGVRTDESRDRKIRYAGKVGDDLMLPHEFMRKYPKYLSKLGVMFRLPVVEYSKADIFHYLNGEQNPLYENFERVGCFPCLAAGDKYKAKCFSFDDFGKSQLFKVQRIEKEIGKSIWTSQTGAGCALCSI